MLFDNTNKPKELTKLFQDFGIPICINFINKKKKIIETKQKAI